MIAALFALAAAMVIAGAAAVIQGFPYVRLESGLAMVIAGAVTASSGAVLFGLGVVASGLRRVERTAFRTAAVPADGLFEGPTVLPQAPMSEGRPRLPPVLPAAAAFAVPPMVEPAAPSERPRTEPGLHAAERQPPAAPAEPELPIPGLTPPPVPERNPEPSVSDVPPIETLAVTPPEDDLFAAPEGGPDAEAMPALRRSLDAAPDPELESEAKPPRNVVGRYASGGNTYVMFEDGSIEAETPQGRFTFSSLDELKAFVDGGGESGTRGAA